MCKKVNVDSPNIVITGISPKMKNRVNLLAKEEFKDMSSYLKGLIYRDQAARMSDIEKLERNAALA